MVECAVRNNSELVIVSRDADYGVAFEDVAYINDHLRQEFSERVSRKRKLLLYTKLSEALKHFAVAVTAAEEAEEEEIARTSAVRRQSSHPAATASSFDVDELLKEPGLLAGPTNTQPPPRQQ